MRPVDSVGFKYRRVRHLKNRRDTLIKNILSFSHDSEVVRLNRNEIHKINRQLIALGAQ